MRSHADLLKTYAGEPGKWDMERIRKIFGEAREECLKNGFYHSAKLAATFESRCLVEPRPVFTLVNNGYTWGSIRNDIETLEDSFSSELRRELFFHIPSDKERYFERDNLFGPEVAQEFPSCAGDIRNSGTCFAVEQYDGAVFHLMQVLQIALNSLAQKFGVPFGNTNWQNVIDQIEAKVRKIDSSFGPNWKQQQKVYSEVALHFRYLKDAWRNHIMHEHIPYDEGKALSIWNHVDGFMQELVAGGLSEPGADQA